jgi:hypothetical protein
LTSKANIALYGFMQSTDPGNQKQTFVEHSLLFRASRDNPNAVKSLLGSYFLAVLLTSKTFSKNPGKAPYRFFRFTPTPNT